MAVKNYSCSDNTQLSEHFNVQEFRCKCGKTHDILIADELITKLETLFEKLNCSKIIVISAVMIKIISRFQVKSCAVQHRTLASEGLQISHQHTFILTLT